MREQVRGLKEGLPSTAGDRGRVSCGRGKAGPRERRHVGEPLEGGWQERAAPYRGPRSGLESWQGCGEWSSGDRAPRPRCAGHGRGLSQRLDLSGLLFICLLIFIDI